MSLVLFEIRDNVALLTLNNPDKRNMLTREVCGLIVDYVAQAEQHPDVKALIVTGAGRAFCAGGQLKDLTPDKEMLETIYSVKSSLLHICLSMIVSPHVCWGSYSRLDIYVSLSRSMELK